MNIDLPNQPRFRERDLAKALDKHVSTVVRWRQRGVRGHVLRSYLVGGQRYIDRQDFVNFITALNGSESGTSPLPPPDHEEKMRRVNEELDRAGI